MGAAARGAAPPGPAAEVPALRLTGLSRRYPSRSGGVAVLANDDISFELARGDVLGLLGANGAGKSTLVRQLAGVLRPDAGRIEVLGHDTTAAPGLAARLVAYLAQEETALREMPLLTAVATTARLRGADRAEARVVAREVMAELGLVALAERPLSSLSGGQRRLGEVATALVGDRPLLLLDEPTTGLDPSARALVWAALRRRAAAGTTALVVTHHALEAEPVLDRVLVLDGGRVAAAGRPEELKALLGDAVRLDLVWRGEPPAEPVVSRLRSLAAIEGPRWQCALARDDARQALGELLRGAAGDALADFTLTTPSLEEASLAFGDGRRP